MSLSFQRLSGSSRRSLNLRSCSAEAVVLLLGAKTHHALDPGPVVPTAVEQDDLAARGQVGDVALEVPLGLLTVARGGQGGDAAPARIEVLGDPLDHPALARRVAALHDDHKALLLVPDPLVHAHQLRLQPEESLVVNVLVSHGTILHLSNAPVCETAGPACRTAGPVCETAGPACRTAGPVCETAGPGCRTAGPVCRTAGPGCRKRPAGVPKKAGRASRNATASPSLGLKYNCHL
jgi:hypothetical protein